MPGDAAQSVLDTVKSLRKALQSDPDCAAWLGAHAGKDGLDKSIARMKVGEAADVTDASNQDLQPGVNATANDVGSYDFVINFKGSFFTSAQGRRFDILIHEIAHVLSADGFGTDYNTVTGANQTQQAQEEAIIMQHCSKTVNGK